MGNTVRVIRKPHEFRVSWDKWEVPPIFRMIQSIGNVPDEDARQALNMGIGLVLVLPSSQSDGLIAALRKKGETPVIVGEVIR